MHRWEGVGARVLPPLKRSRKEKAKAPRILEAKLAEPPKKMSKAEGGLSYPPLSWGAQLIWSYFLKILEFVILQQQSRRTWGLAPILSFVTDLESNTYNNLFL